MQRTPTHRLRSACFLLAASALFGACQNTRENLTSEWSEALESMTLRPVYPPREDFQVGDLYLRHAAAPALEQWIATIDLRAQAAEFYAQRAPFPQTGNTRSASTGGNRAMRHVVFPEFSGVNVRGQNIAWLIPAEALSLAEGESWQGDHEVTLKISSAESYGLPFSLISQALVEERKEDGKIAQYLRPELGISLPTIARTQATPEAGILDPHVRFDVVTEVYYARAIDISITRMRKPAHTDVEPIELVDAAAKDDNRSLVEALNKRLIAIAPSTPRTTLRILGASDATVVLRRTFKEPIAIGFRSMTVTLDRKTGAVLSYDSQNPLPEAVVPKTKRERFDLEGALAIEVADDLQGQAELLELHYDSSVSRWRLHVKLQEGAEAPFFHYSQRESIATRVRARANRLSDEDKRRLQRFVDAGGMLFEPR